MLEDRLSELSALVNWFTTAQAEFGDHTFDCNCQAVFDKTRKAWINAIFSAANELRLKRYFGYHLEGISALSDTLHTYIPTTSGTGSHAQAANELQLALLSLIRDLRTYYKAYLPALANAPAAWRRNEAERLFPLIRIVEGRIGQSPISHGLKSCLQSYLSETLALTAVDFYTFQSVDYARRVMEELLLLDFNAPGTEDLINQVLEKLNFNMLSYFIYRQKNLKQPLKGIDEFASKLQFLRAEKEKLSEWPPSFQDSCQPLWPSLNQLLSNWMDEELSTLQNIMIFRQQYAGRQKAQKIPLNLSVAQLACLLKLFYEEGHLGNASLTDIFKFVSHAYTTKRQSHISTGSLSKEFYSTTQVTAAKVQYILEKMVTRINHDFFPR